jgi:hypothetical protein
MGTRGPSVKSEQKEQEADHLLPSSGKIRNLWSHASSWFGAQLNSGTILSLYLYIKTFYFIIPTLFLLYYTGRKHKVQIILMRVHETMHTGATERGFTVSAKIKFRNGTVLIIL